MPGGFIPAQDKQYLIAVAQLPPAAIDRRAPKQVMRRMIGEIGIAARPGVEHAVQFAGMSVNGLCQSSSSGIVFFALIRLRQAQGPRTSPATPLPRA